MSVYGDEIVMSTSVKENKKSSGSVTVKTTKTMSKKHWGVFKNATKKCPPLEIIIQNSGFTKKLMKSESLK